MTLFVFDAGEELTDHTSPFDAIVLTLEGTLTLTIGGRAVQAGPQTMTLMPAHVPHVGVQELRPAHGDEHRIGAA